MEDNNLNKFRSECLMVVAMKAGEVRISNFENIFYGFALSAHQLERSWNRMKIINFGLLKSLHGHFKNRQNGWCKFFATSSPN